MNKLNYIVLIGAGYWGEKILDKLIQLNQKVILIDKDLKKYIKLSFIGRKTVKMKLKNILT